MVTRTLTSGLLAVVALMGAAAQAWAQSPAAAAPDPTCIGVVLPSAKGASGDATQFASSLRDLFVSYLTGPSLRAIPLEARLASQAVTEARQKQCGYVLITSVERKRHDGSGWGKTLGRAAGTAAWYGVPYAGNAAANAARGAAIAGAQAVSMMAETTKAKDELTLEFRIGSPDSVMQAAPRTEKGKARNDGEDLLTPLVEKAAEAIAATVTTPRR